MSYSESKGAGKESVCMVQLSSSGTTKAIRSVPCRYLYCTTKGKHSGTVIHLCWCGIKRLQLGKGILYRNKRCTLPTATLCLLRHRPTILLSIGGYCSCTGLKENEREKLGNSLPKIKVAGNFEVFLHVYMHVWVHQLLHKEGKKQQGKCIGRALFCVLYPPAVPGRPS